MRKNFLIIFVFAALAGFAAAQQKTQKKSYVGYRHEGVVYGATLPNGVKDLGGGLMSSDEYGVTRFTKNGRYMLWLEKVVSRNKNGVPNWQVKDVLTFGKLKKNQEFLFSYSASCLQDKKENLDLIVQAELVPKTKNYKIINAWNADLTREKFEKVAIKGIKCSYVEQ